MPFFIKLTKQFAVFCSVGVVNTLVALGAILFFLEIVGLHYMISNLLGYIIGLIVAFFGHSQFTFNEGKKTYDYQNFIMFIIVFIVSYGLQFACLYILVEIQNMGVIVAQILSMGMYTLVNFLLNKFWTFNKE